MGCVLKNITLVFMLFILFNCGGEVPNLVTEGSANVPVDLDKRDTIWGEGESILFGGDGSPPPAGEGSGIGVNAFLWRASLDIVSNLPIASADPFGGVIITDWYSDTSIKKIPLRPWVGPRSPLGRGPMGPCDILMHLNFQRSELHLSRFLAGPFTCYLREFV